MRVARLFRYPVKSFAGEEVSSLPFQPGGITGDRGYAVVLPGEDKPRTARHHHALLSFRSYTSDGSVRVRTPAGKEAAIDDAAWLDELEAVAGERLEVQAFPNHVFDDSELLIVNAASVRALSSELGRTIDPCRFRANVVIDGDDVAPFMETAWIGSSIGLGANAAVYGSYLCERCVVPSIDLDTLIAEPAFLRHLVQRHEASFGLYCKIVRGGDVRVGDTVHVELARQDAAVAEGQAAS